MNACRSLAEVHSLVPFLSNSQRLLKQRSCSRNASSIFWGNWRRRSNCHHCQLLGVSLVQSSAIKRIHVLAQGDDGRVYHREGGERWRQEDGPLATETEIVHEYEEVQLPRQTVAIFWDLDNKPPNLVPAYDAAVRLKGLAGEYGEVVDMVAYANQNAFNYVPERVREERRDRRMLDDLEKRGIVKVEQPYVCRMCGRKCRSNLALKKHFKQLHERERNKRMSFLKQLKGKKRVKFMDKMAGKESKYKEAAKTVMVPKVGYGLAYELRKAGVAVRTVEKKPQAADEALLRHMHLYINRGIECIFLVSDDSDFLGILKLAKSKSINTIVVGDSGTLKGVADALFSWSDVASGRAVLTARKEPKRRTDEDALRNELLKNDDELLKNDDVEDALDDDACFSDGDEEEFLGFQRSIRQSGKLSAFSDDEEYISGEEEDHDEEDNGEGEDTFGDLDTKDARGLSLK